MINIRGECLANSFDQNLHRCFWHVLRALTQSFLQMLEGFAFRPSLCSGRPKYLASKTVNCTPRICLTWWCTQFVDPFLKHDKTLPMVNYLLYFIFCFMPHCLPMEVFCISITLSEISDCPYTCSSLFYWLFMALALYIHRYFIIVDDICEPLEVLWNYISNHIKNAQNWSRMRLERPI
jgi:hypothetical protein